MGSDIPFWRMVDTVSAFGFKTNLVRLDCIDKSTVSQVLSNLLQLSPCIVCGLSDIIYHKTKGNPLFVSKLLLSINREELLHLSLTRYHWEWDERKIQSRKLPDDVAMFFVHSINTIPIDVEIALFTLSCFGASMECKVIGSVDTDLGMNLIELLRIAIAEGLLNNMDGKYFSAMTKFMKQFTCHFHLL
jgi:predicted ATPase